MIMKKPKTCAMCGKVWTEVPEEHRLDAELQVYYWECNGSLHFLERVERCDSTMTYMPDFEFTLAKIAENFRKGK